MILVFKTRLGVPPRTRVQRTDRDQVFIKSIRYHDLVTTRKQRRQKTSWFNVAKSIFDNTSKESFNIP